MKKKQLECLLIVLIYLMKNMKLQKHLIKNHQWLKWMDFGEPTIVLFSHDLIQQYQQYELQGQTHRKFPDVFVK